MATVPAAATTPPPPGRVHTPPPPLHGARFDSYEPYSPRRSSRVAAQRERAKVAITSPTLLAAARATTPPNQTQSKSLQARNQSQTFSPPSSPGSPVKLSSPTRQPGQRSNRRRYLNVVAVSADSDSDAPGASRTLNNATTLEPANMLPTPSKTPRKRTEHTTAAVSSAARILFPGRPAALEDVMPSPRKSRKGKKTALSLESFAEQCMDDGDKIEIYTDSKDRVPTLDEDEDNPFVTSKKPETAARPNNSKNSSKRRKVVSERDAEMEAKVKNEEGMIYVFRGKKIFRRFDEDDGDDGERASADEEQETFSETETRRKAGRMASQRFMRSSIKPRLLFPSEEQKRAKEMAEEEEALTEIEEPAPNGLEVAAESTEDLATPGVTPIEERFQPIPVTPPPTTRTTRSTVKISVTELTEQTLEVPEAEQTEVVAAPKPKKASPFDSWRRTKSSTALAAKGLKREGDHIEREGGNQGKRTRSGAHLAP